MDVTLKLNEGHAFIPIMKYLHKSLSSSCFKVLEQMIGAIERYGDLNIG